jgi:hypothetical protein
MSSLKQLIFNALMKCSIATVPEFDTVEEARDAFIKIMMVELFPEDSSFPTAAVESPGRKKRGPMTDEAKAAMKAKRDATVAAKKSGESPVPVKAETDTEEKPKAEEKPKKAKKVKAEPVVETKVEPVAEEKPKKEKKAEEKPKKEKKVKPTEDANLQKVDPTWRKHLKKAAGDKHSKEQEAELLTYLNGLTKEEFDGKKAEEHVKAFLGAGEPAPAAPATKDEKVEADLEIVEFDGKEYFVNPDTKRVYEGEGEYDEESGWTNYNPVGYVGMAAFAEMTL